ncbi:GntR family transcriptional regulator [Spirochaetota bacterium]
MNTNNTITQYTIDKSSYTPIYIQLKDILKDLILKKRIKPEEKIPSENELSKAFDISRMTVREAIKELVKDNFLYVKKGEGTFVKSSVDTQMFISLDGFSTEMSKRGFKVSSKILSVQKIDEFQLHREAYNALSADKTHPVVLVKRIRYLDNTPYAIESSYLPFHIGADLITRNFDSTFSIYSYLEREMNITLNRAEHTIQPQLADDEVVKLIKIKSKSPVLFIKGITYDKGNNAIEYLEGTYRGDKYRLKIEIKQ